ncbi:MAG: PAS domain-containing protein, partial [Candidatus Marinimicrobia bacterium]|nr:PAS domain-containing protein [Candidatus Neomarinimicrobiota bacterium]
MKSFTDQPLSEVDTLELLGSMLSHVSSAPSVIMQSTGDILYFHGNTEKYLMPGKGKASMNIVQMACAGLKEELVRVLRPGKAFTREVIIKDIQIGDIKDGVRINVTIKPIQGKVDSKPLLIVFFQDNLAEKNVNKHPAQPAKNVKVKKNVSELEKQLKSANFELELALQEAQTNNEELQSTNEELQSINEELQSTNEELETTQEELQSLNEESMTVNTELQARIAEINTVNDDILNLMDSTEIATIFLDLKLQVQRFTSPAADIIPLRSIDRGRPLNQLAAPFQDIDLTELSREVLEDLEAREQEVQTKNNKYFFLRIIPYRTIANVVAGVVITFREITEIKKAGQKVADARDFAENIIATVREPLLVLDADLKVISANHSFIKNFLVEEEGTTGKFIYKLGNGQWDIPALRNLLEKMLIDTSEITDYRVDHDFESIGRRSMLLNARRVRQEARKATLILLAIEDITEINKTSQKVTDARDFAENIIATVREPLLVLDADLKVIGANHSFINNFLVDEKRTTGKFIYELGNGQWDIPALRHLLEKMLIDTSEITDYRVDHDFESIGQRSMLLNARRVRQETDKATLILLSIEDITEINKANQKVADARDFAESIIATVRAPLMVLDADLKVIGANHSFNKNFLVKEKSSTGKFIYELGNGQWDIPALRILLEKMLIDTSEITDYRVDHDFESIGKRSMLLNARRVRQEADKATLILLAMEDITDRVTGT